MANLRTVGSGKDHSTIGAAVTWFENIANHDFDTDGIGTIEVYDNVEYNENVLIDGLNGGMSLTAYLWLKAASGNRHSGVSGTGHVRIRGNTNGSHVLSLQHAWIRISGFEIQQDSTGDSDEGVRLGSGSVTSTNFLIEDCIIWTDQSTANQDGLYAGNWGASVSVSNTDIYGFTRAGVHAQMFLDAHDQTWNLDACFIYDNGDNVINRNSNSGNTTTINAYNTVAHSPSTGVDYKTFGGAGTETYAGSDNIASDTTAESNFTTSFDSVLLVASSPGSGENFWVNNITGGSEDFTLAGENAFTVNANGINRGGSEPDSRQDLSVDIVGTTRHATTPDIGPFEFVPAGGGRIMSSLTNYGGLAGKGGVAGIGGGLAG